MEAGNTSAVVAAGDALVEQSEEVMVPTGGGNPTLGMAHLMKPLVSEDILYYPPPPTVLIASNPNSQNLKKWCLKGSKTSPKARWNLWVNTLEPRYGEIWRRTGIYEAIKASTFSVPRDKMLLLGFAEFWTALNNDSILLFWRPYSLIQSGSMLSNLYKDKEQWVVVESDAVEAFARCLRASNLNGLGYTEPYFPQRVARQFGLDQDIPLLVRNIALGSYDRPIRGVKVYIPPRDFQSDVTARYSSWWKGLLAVNENYVDNSNHEQQLLALLPCEHQSNAESFEAPGSLSGCVMQSLEAGPSTAQLNSQLGKPDGFDKRNDPGNDSVLSSDDDVDEDSLTITQLLSRTRKRENFENARDVGNEHVLNTSTSNLMALAICPDTTNGLTCTSEPLEMSVPSFKGKKSKLSSDKQA
ncbi:hypothetical protein ACET3Z_003514 [Daucus carota]